MDGKKRSKAAALTYDRKQDGAPRVVASGKGFVADRIVEIAREAKIPIVEDAALVSALLVLELGEEVPVELYEAVAKILSFVYRLDKERRP
ncbi:EscU/YscU/HrcU family type III secretion system export apparatus switch protein [Aminiphilus circumscriptus]|jgi:flagellar biosynthesis protein|uniref:EscU/YscU/HrcU family type III secretion system export apparatus switch protein n=1 Tax=Aminiphilus circumscriptus TaxID=290732 RepID=UPI00049282BB|nr:EscU/YscU/HrcU family type III secretion system export apparatus switch protein [Aminiphilus circumscriptus]